MALGLELDALPGIRYKVDTNHDIVYMEFDGEAPSVNSLRAIFTRAGLSARFVGALPDEVRANKKRTQRITL